MNKYRKFPERILPVLLCLLLSLAACGSDRLSAPEEAAVRFYKEVWVEGHTEGAESMLESPGNARDLGWRIRDVKDDARKNPPILVVQSPTDTQMHTKTILIHRPADKRDFKVRLHKTDGSWKVVKFQQNFDPRAGGYVSHDSYQRLAQEYPGIQWKEVKNP